MKFSEIKAARQAAGPASTGSAKSIRNGHPSRLERQPVEIIEVEAGSYQEPLVMSLSGEAGCGKSRLIGTAGSSTKAVGVVPLENKTRQSVLKAAKQFGVKVYMPEINLIRAENPMRIAAMPPACITEEDHKGKSAALIHRMMLEKSAEYGYDSAAPDCCHIHYYRWHTNRTKSCCFRLVEMSDVWTVAIDTFGQFVEDMLYANYGRVENIMPLEKKAFNQEVREFLAAMSHKNLILTHHLSAIWKDNKPTNKNKPKSSFNKLGHFTNVAVEMSVADRKVKGQPQWTLEVKNCTANPELNGLELLHDGDISYRQLCECIYPDGEWGDLTAGGN